MFNVEDLPPEIQEKVYRPGVDGMIEDVELELQENKPPVKDGGWGMRNGDPVVEIE